MNKKVLAIVFFTVFMDLVGFGIIIPIQTAYALSFGATATVVTLLSASFSAMQFLFAPFWGGLSDRFGRRPIILSSIVFSAVGYYLFAEAGSLAVLFGARILSGFGSANIAAAQAAVADTTTPEKRAKGMGLIGVAFGLGFIIGPVIGGIFSQWSLAGPAYISCVLCGLNFLFALLFLPETLKKDAPRAHSQAKKGIAVISMQSFQRAFQYVDLPRLLWLFFGVTLAFSMLEQSVALLIQEIWYPDATAVAGQDLAKAQEDLKGVAHMTMLVLLVVGITAAIVQGSLIGKLAARYGERKLIITGTSLLVVGLILFPLAAYTTIFALALVVTVFLSFGTGIVNPSLTSQLSLSVSDSEQGEFLGLGQSLSSLGRVFGPSATGMLFEFHSFTPFGTGAFLMATCVWVSLGLKAKKS
ncbi:MAG: tetracycline resistance MFS efflux pump [Myxococcales bacterium]|nr:tetracycline resistance MFS efflux pump [Myxococcales bacterium]|tara:strand:- start:648 stop:1889 length:1242 start_codon:yes stop_codon:yes gene_type:complete